MLFGFNEPEVPTVEAEDVKHAMDTHEACVVLDVRTPGEFSRGKLAGSINCSVEQVGQSVETLIPNKKQKIYVYCLSGARSSVAVETMMRMGYTNVFHMNHGLLAWRAKYFPVS